MKKRTEFVVVKRDGRREWLRTSKLARSILFAFEAVRPQGEGVWRAVEMAGTVLCGLRGQLRRHGEPGSPLADATPALLTTAAIHQAVEDVLVATGYADVAMAYSSAAERRRRRRSTLRSGSLGHLPPLGNEVTIGDDSGRLPPSALNDWAINDGGLNDWGGRLCSADDLRRDQGPDTPWRR